MAELAPGPMRGRRLDILGFSVFSEEPATRARAYSALAEAALAGDVDVLARRWSPLDELPRGLGASGGRHGRASSSCCASERGRGVGSFREDMAAGYGFEVPTIRLGRPFATPAAIETAVEVGIPLGFLNRHGLIAGATGTGKTRTLQLIAEQVSAAGCPVFAADMKGDLAGIGAAGAADDKLTARAAELADAVGAGRLPGGAAVADRRGRRAAAGDGHRVRADAALEGAEPERDPGVEPGARSSGSATRRGWRSSTWRTCARRWPTSPGPARPS